jgi:hypothetical protein
MKNLFSFFTSIKKSKVQLTLNIILLATWIPSYLTQAIITLGQTINSLNLLAHIHGPIVHLHRLKLDPNVIN